MVHLNNLSDYLRRNKYSPCSRGFFAYAGNSLNTLPPLPLKTFLIILHTYERANGCGYLTDGMVTLSHIVYVIRYYLSSLQ